MAPGPIPYVAIKEYSRDRSFNEFDERLFRYVIRAMDEVYLEWYNEESERKSADSRGK